MSKTKKIAITSIVGVLVLGFLVCMLGFILLAGYIASNENAHKELAKDGRSCVPMAPPDGNPYQEKFQAAAARGQAPSGGDGKYVVPMAGVITSPYGRRDNPLGTGGDADDALNFHRGVDLAGVPEGTPFYAAASGTVKSVDYGGPDGGNGIIISGDDGVEYWYWHAATGTSKVRQGQHVEAGTELAGAGQTGLASGVHLHFEIHVNGQHTDPVPFMKERGITLGQGGDQSGGGQHKDGGGDKKPAKSRPLTSEERQRVLETAASGVGDGSTYRQGGNDFKSWDASGYVQWVYRQAGVNLPRTHQWEYGVKVDSPEPGDLVVQVPDGDGWAHVGIYAGDGKMYSALNSEDGTLLHSIDWTDSAQYYRLSVPDEEQ